MAKLTYFRSIVGSLSFSQNYNFVAFVIDVDRSQNIIPSIVVISIIECALYYVFYSYGSIRNLNFALGSKINNG